MEISTRKAELTEEAKLLVYFLLKFYTDFKIDFIYEFEVSCCLVCNPNCF